MRQEQIFVFLYGLLVGTVCMLMSPAAPIPTESAILGLLGLACLLGMRLLLELAGRLPWLSWLLLAVAVATAFAYGGGLYPFGCVLLAMAAQQFARGGAALPLAAVGAVLYGMVVWPPAVSVYIMPACVMPLFVLHFVFTRLALSHAQTAACSEENARLRQRLAEQHKMTSAMEHAARLAERNRLSARIHDEVGHGISGSILLLEGARLSMDQHPDKAREALATATANLRASVDDIRAALREERVKPGDAGLAQIAAMLTRFEVQHPDIHTHLTTEGELSALSPLVWVCLAENLKEALTNLLKHSTARNFSVSIRLHNKLVKASFADDGPASPFTPGMGLAAMEERCALCHGRCFFTAGPRGFSVVMTFTRLAEG